MMAIKYIKDIALDFLFPKFCVGCDKEGEWLCADCKTQIIPVVSQVCPECGRLSENGRYHSKCAKGKSLKGIIAASYFEEGPIREMIHNFKYNGVLELGDKLADLMATALRMNIEARILNIGEEMKILNQYSGFNIQNSILTFVPLHWRRQAQRGYNQAEALAQAIGAKLGIDTIDLLTKKRATRRQAELAGMNRRTNLSDVFIMNSTVDIKNKKIVIVDDVTTTGSTLNECARVLRLAGAKEVWGLVVARG